MRPLLALLVAPLLLASCAGSPPPPVAVPTLPAAPALPGACALRPACDAPLALPSRPFRHTTSHLVRMVGEPRHRGRDQFVRPGGPAWVLGKFAYGIVDKDLKDEDVDVFLLRGCEGSWEKVGTYRTSTERKPHPPVLGVDDRGGQIFVDLSTESLPNGPLGVGRHRVRMVVPGDGTSADVFFEVLPPGARVVVSDIDGTLSSSEAAIVGDLLTGRHSEAHPGAAQVMSALGGRGYFLFYLTARPSWLVPRTRDWLDRHGFPPGILHTTAGSTGVIGAAAAAFKSSELTGLKQAVGLVPELAFGNMPSDVATYADAGIPAGRAYFYRLDGDLRGGVRHDDYRGLLPELGELPAACPPDGPPHGPPGRRPAPGRMASPDRAGETSKAGAGAPEAR